MPDLTLRETTEPITPTLIERLNRALPIPYTVTALLIAALLGPLGFYIADLLDFLDIGKATDFFARASFGNYGFWQVVGNNIVYPLIIFYCAVMVRYMRLRIIRAQKDLLGDSSEGDAKMKEAFGGISRTAPAIGIAALIVLLSSTLIVSQVQSNSGLAQLYFAVDYPLFFFGVGTFIWVYARSLWGLYQLGRGPLSLESHSEDPLMGLEGFGELSLTFSTVYFVAVFFGLYMFSAFAADVPILLFAGFSAFLILGGLTVFFIPLLRIHGKMVQQKESLRNRNISEIVRFAARAGESGGRSSLGDFKGVLLLDYERVQIQSISNWPFQNAVVRALILIIIGITVSTLAHIALAVLGI